MLDQNVKDLSHRLEVGDTIRVVCPRCNASHEKSFVITRTNVGLLYYCHRASCGTQGLVADYRDEPIKKKVFVPQVVTEELVTLPAEIYLQYLEKYEISYNDLNCVHGIKYAPTSHSLYFPILSPWQGQVGSQLKRLAVNATPKVYSFKVTEDPFIHFPPNLLNEYEELVLVEDYISSIKVHELYSAASLNGTNLSVEGIKLLKHIGVKKLSIMFDGDTAGITAATSLAKRLAGFFSCRVIVLPIGYDPKDLSFSDLEDLLYES